MGIRKTVQNWRELEPGDKIVINFSCEVLGLEKEAQDYSNPPKLWVKTSTGNTKMFYPDLESLNIYLQLSKKEQEEEYLAKVTAPDPDQLQAEKIRRIKEARAKELRELGEDKYAAKIEKELKKLHKVLHPKEEVEISENIAAE